MRTVSAEFEQLESQFILDCNQATEPVNVETVLPDGNRRAGVGAFRGFRGNWLSICTAERIALSSVAAVQYNNVLFIGEVLACAREMDAAWIIRIKVKRMLTNFQSLIRLRSALIAQPVPSEPRIWNGLYFEREYPSLAHYIDDN